MVETTWELATMVVMLVAIEQMLRSSISELVILTDGRKAVKV